MNENLKENRLGNLNGFTGGSFAGQVYGIDGLGPSITTMGGGGREPHILIEDFYENREVRVYDKYSPSIRSERNGLKVVENDKSKTTFN